MNFFACPKALLNRVPAAAAAATQRKAVPAAASNASRSMHTGWSSLYEGSVFPTDNNNNNNSNSTSSSFTVRDEGYDASSYGYRVVVSTPPRRHYSSSMTQLHQQAEQQAVTNDHYFYHHQAGDDYNTAMGMTDPASLDILSSPEVLKILESAGQNGALGQNTADDPYLSDCEEMEREWDETCGISVAYSDVPMDEKRM